jgi:hypothetical protein
MLALANATIDDTAKPAIEWIGGRSVQKLMPTDLHALVTGLFWQALYDRSKRATAGRGMVGNEWRYIIPPNAYATESVVPDVSYLATYFDLPKADQTHEANGVTHLTAADVLTSRAFPTLTIDLRALFAELDEPENA